MRAKQRPGPLNNLMCITRLREGSAEPAAGEGDVKLRHYPRLGLLYEVASVLNIARFEAGHDSMGRLDHALT